MNDQDVDFEEKTIRIREGKGGREAIVPLNPEVIPVLMEYLKIRPSLKVNGEQPLFVTDFGNRWCRFGVYRMYKDYKKKANITKPGALHVFCRHAPASIMIKNGSDNMTIKEILRHKDIETSARYIHISSETKREKFERYLVL